MLKELFGSIFGGQSAGVKSVSVNDTFIAVKKGGVQFIDVRTEAEFRGGHASKALNYPLDKLGGMASKLDSEEPVYVICQSGMRSMRGANLLISSGFKEVYNVAGGTSAWMSAELDTERPKR